VATTCQNRYIINAKRSSNMQALLHMCVLRNQRSDTHVYVPRLVLLCLSSDNASPAEWIFIARPELDARTSQSAEIPIQSRIRKNFTLNNVNNAISSCGEMLTHTPTLARSLINSAIVTKHRTNDCSTCFAGSVPRELNESPDF